MKNAILKYFPAHLTPRPQQADTLLAVQDAWDTNDVIVLCLPTGVGKTEVMVTIAQWQAAQKYTSNLLVPTNAQLDQFSTRYPDIQTLHARKGYTCADARSTCADVVKLHKRSCDNCVHKQAKALTKDAAVRLMNCHTYWATTPHDTGLYADVAIYDEAHNLADMLRETLPEFQLLRSEYGFPDEITKLIEIVEWMEATMHADAVSPLLYQLFAGITKPQDAVIAEWKKRKDLVIGKDENNNDIYDKELLFRATSARGLDKLAPKEHVRKVVLLSATINHRDVYEMGLDHHRVKYISSDNPIPPSRRPIKFKSCINMAYQYKQWAIPALVVEINKLLALKSGKGLIHAPYSVAVALMQSLDNPRLMYHDKYNKREAIKAFKDSPQYEGKVLVASGLYEGVDLPYKQAEWQVITKVPFLSLGDAVVAAKAAEIQDWYDWETLKRVIQATGRIVRAADDHGETWIFDSNFEALLNRDRHRETPMLPADIRAAIQLIPKDKP